MIVINFKTYEKATGEKARELAERCRKAADETGRKVVACPSQEDLLRLDHVGLPVFSQHIDPVEFGSHTGSVLAEGVKKAGATGTLLNHSEKRMEEEELEKAVEKAKIEDITVIVCARSPEECGRYAEFKPDYIAFEPPELIGSDTSVSEAKPELIEKAVEKSGEVSTLTGAGIKEKEDVEKSIELGCEGVLVASGVVKSDDPYEEVKELCRGLEDE